MGQFEYTVPLSPVKPEDIERVAKEYLAKKKENDQNEIKVDNERRILSSRRAPRRPR
jgi:hypothetical protein